MQSLPNLWKQGSSSSVLIARSGWSDLKDVTTWLVAARNLSATSVEVSMDRALVWQRWDVYKRCDMKNGSDAERLEENKRMHVRELVDSDKRNRKFYRRREMQNSWTKKTEWWAKQEPRPRPTSRLKNKRETQELVELNRGLRLNR